MSLLRKIGLPCVALAAGLSLVLAPVSAHAVTSSELQSEYAAASARLSELASDVDAADAELNETREKVAETNASLDRVTEELGERQAELEDARDTLSKRVRATYKNGGISFLGMLLQSESFEDLVSVVYYAGKINERDALAIDAVNEAYDDLQDKKGELEELGSTYNELFDQQEAQRAELEERRQEGQAYVNSLSADLQQKLAEEHQAELDRLAQQEEEENATQEATQNEQQNQNQDQNQTQPEEQASEQNETTQEQPQQQSQQQQQRPTTNTNNSSNSTPTTPPSIGSGPWDNYTSPLSDQRSPDYDAWRRKWISENISSSMSTMQKVVAVLNFVSSHPYDRAKRHYTGIAMYQYGNGTCGSSAEMVKAFCDDLGIPAVIRDASGDVGAVHFNDYVWIDGVRYIVDANPGSNGAMKPRRA